MFVFCLVASVQEGLDRLTTDEAQNRSLIVFQENRFCPTSSRLPEDYAGKIGDVAGVRDVMPIQVWTNNCRASLDIVVFNGADPDQIRRYRPIDLVEGSWQSFSTRRDAAIVGNSIAKRRGLKLGDQFSIGDISVRVAGIFRSNVPAEENLIYTSLRFLQYTNGLNSAGLVTLHEVLVHEKSDPDQVAAAIDAKLRSGSVATKTRRKGAFQAGTLADLIDLIRFAHWLGFACVGLVLSLVATTTVISVQDRIKEYAVLQTIGVRPSRTLGLVLAESTILCGVGGAAGTTIALLALQFGGYAIGAEGATIAFRPSFTLLVTGITVSVVVGIVAGIAPALQAARVNIVGALRNE
jgi:putative ABC transport system permease protein